MHKRHTCCYMWCAVLLITVASMLTAKTSAKDSDVTPKKRTGIVFRADRIYVSEDPGIVRAQGHVVIANKGMLVRADNITYEKVNDKVIAIGNVQIETPEGNTFFVDHALLTDGLKKGYVKRIRALLDSNAKLTALEGDFIQDTEANMNFARYSPCKFCRQNPHSKPLWQIRARNAHWDMKSKDISYSDASFEILGIPVMYVPYISHPDPTVERRTGFLSPTVRGGRFGHLVETPYYVAIDRKQDLLLTPAIGTQAEILGMRYRRRFHNSELSLGGSAGIAQKNRPREKGGTRAHIDSSFKMDINETWRGNIDVKRTSNNSYARLYPVVGFSREQFLKSKVNTEGFYERMYINAEAISFQPLLDSDTPDTVPLIMPSVDINYRTAPQWNDSYWSIDGNILGLKRTRGESIHRAHALTQWNLPFSTRLGDEYKLELGVRTDGYVYRPDNTATTIKTSSVSSRRNLSRVVPHAGLSWKLPLLAQNFPRPLLITPMVSMIQKPRKDWNKKFPNDDSRIREISDINHHDTNRFGGIDKVDVGSRINYGVQIALHNMGLKPTTLYLGQSYSYGYPTADQERPIGSTRRRTDYITRIYTNPHKYVDAYYRGRFTEDKFAARRHELTGALGADIFKFKSTFVFIRRDNQPTDEHGHHQLTSSISSQMTRNWHSEIGLTRNLKNPNRTLNRFARVTYENECLRAQFSIQRSSFFDTIYSTSGITYMVRLQLLTFGNTHKFKD